LNTKTFNQIISGVFHPIIYPLLATLVFLYASPRFLPNSTIGFFLTTVGIGTIFFPLLLLYILLKSQIINSFYLREIPERKYPFIIFILMAIILSRIFFKIEYAYDLGVYFIAGSMSFLIGYWFLYLKIKLSMHTMGLGSFLGFIFQLSMFYQLNFLWTIALLFAIFGLVAKARIDLDAHDLKETVLGFVIGIIPQLLIPYLYQNI